MIWLKEVFELFNYNWYFCKSFHTAMIIPFSRQDKNDKNYKNIQRAERTVHVSWKACSIFFSDFNSGFSAQETILNFLLFFSTPKFLCFLFNHTLEAPYVILTGREKVEMLAVIRATILCTALNEVPTKFSTGSFSKNTKYRNITFKKVGGA